MSGHFVFDANRCTGCGACQVACTIENDLAPGTSWRRIETFNDRRHPAASVFHLSLACNHCATAACMTACPALAYRRDVGTGAVLLDSPRCIGCGYCSWACPYDAPVFDEAAGVMTKCTWCEHRLSAGLRPACVVHCPTAALNFTSGPPASSSEHVTGLPATWLQPNLHVIPLAPGRSAPVMTDPVDAAVPVVQATSSSRKITLRHEWPLAVFTLGAALLVAVIAAAAANQLEPDPWLFALATGVVLATPALHLGRRDRAWRAILNFRNSWLSREVVLLSAFAVAAIGWLFLAPGDTRVGWLVTTLGFAGLVSADCLYGVLPGGNRLFRSAGIVASALVLAAGFAQAPRLTALFVGANLNGYIRHAPPRTGRVRRRLAVLRGIASVVGALLIWSTYWPAVALLIIGAIIDRAEFYGTLARTTPRAEMDRELAEMTTGLVVISEC